MSKTNTILQKRGARIEESLGKRTRTQPKLVEVASDQDRQYEGRSRAKDTAEIELDRIIADDQHREHFDESDIVSLADSLRSTGLLQPIIVRWDGPRSLYIVIAGERRYRAAQLAGFETVTCVVKQDTTPAEIAEMQLAENFARKDLNPIELANAFQDVIQKCECTARDLAKKLGVNETTVTRHLRLLRLPPDIQAQVASGDVPVAVAREIARLDDEQTQRDLLDRAVNEALSSSAVADAASAAVRPASKQRLTKTKRSSRRPGRPLTFQTDHAVIVVKPKPDATTYDHLAESLQQALEEVQCRIDGRVSLR